MTQKSIKLSNGETIPYYLERRARRTVGLKITETGLVVHAPKYILEFQLKKLIQDKSNWILNKLESRKQNAVPPLSWQNGETLQLLGNPLSLSVLLNNKNKKPHVEHNTLTIASPEAENPSVIKHKVTQWYKKQAMSDFKRRLEILATKLDVPTPPLKLSNAQSRWGSCSSRGDIRLNWRLLQAPPHIINYVICHELAHLKEMNHSARFWAVVGSLYPDYKNAEKELKQIGHTLHRL
ncbi:MAG: M48 family metallopeptidase [Methylophilaceae bacterium]